MKILKLVMLLGLGGNGICMWISLHSNAQRKV